MHLQAIQLTKYLCTCRNPITNSKQAVAPHPANKLITHSQPTKGMQETVLSYLASDCNVYCI